MTDFISSQEINEIDKPTIAVLDLEINNIAMGDMKQIVSLISSYLFQSNQYAVINVAKRDRILEEIKFSLSDCADESCQIEIGKILSAEFLVVGSVGKVGSKYILSLRSIDVSTSKTINTSDGVFPNMDALIEGLEPLVHRLSVIGAAEVKPAKAPAEQSNIGICVDAHFLGTTYWDAGAGLTFFDDKVVLLLSLGLSPPGRFNGYVIGAKLLATIVTIPYGFFFGPDWSAFSSSLAVGAQFSYFTMSENTIAFTSEGLLLGAIVGRAEVIRFEVLGWRIFNAFSFYTEAQLWFISSDVEAEVAFRMAFGFRADVI